MNERVTTLTVSSNGRVVIPAAMRAVLGLNDGDKVIARIQDGAIVLERVEAAVRRVQARMARYARPGVSLADELIAERRAEAAREQDGPR